MIGSVRLRLDGLRPRGRRSSAVADAALALLAIGAALAEVAGGTGTSGTLTTVIAVVGGAALVLRRSAPLPVLATTLASAIAIAALDSGVGDPIEASGPSIVIALYTTAAICERRVSLAALASTVAVVSMLSVATADVEGREISALDSAILTGGLAVGTWGLGAYTQTRRRYLRELEQRAVQAEREREQLARIATHEERAAIARELHDIVAHSVSVMLVGVRGARNVLGAAPEVADETLARVETSGEQSLAELRRILALMRTPEHKAEPHPQPSLAELDELLTAFREAGLPVRLEVVGEPHRLHGGVELSVYRIVQEALTNALRHTSPSTVDVTLSFEEQWLELEVVDDGQALDPAEAAIGHGLVGMRERVALLGGRLEAGHRQGGGFRVAARLPVAGR